MTVAEAGRKGGSKTLEKFGKNHFKEISRKGVEARRKNKSSIYRKLT